MHLHKLSLGVLIALLNLLAPFSLKFSVPLTVPQVLAQTSSSRKAEADRLLQQGVQQFQASQFQAALKSFQQALSIYREIKDRQGEGRALAGQGGAYLGLQDQAHAIESAKQSLAIAREINNRQLEEVAQNVLSLAQGQNNPRKSEADRLLQQGFQQYQANQFTAALESSEKALQIYREIKNRPGEEFALLILGGSDL